MEDDIYYSLATVDDAGYYPSTPADFAPTDSTPFVDLPTASSLPASASSSGTNWLQDLLAGVGAISSLGSTAANLYKATDTQQVPGSYNAKGQFIPLGSSSGVLSVPGQTSLLGSLTSPASSLVNPLSGLGTVASSALGSIAPYFSYIVIGGLIFIALKVFRVIK